MGSGSDRNNGSGSNGNGTKTGTGSGVWSSDGHGYCLRWNNHKSNLVDILEALIKMECYVDVTIYVDHHVQFKAHRVVLAACSPFFAEILKDAPIDHCNLLFPGLGEFEMRILLEYIYAGEVNIVESEIPRIMKIARQLEVKGLFDMVDLTSCLSTHQHPLCQNTFFRQEVRPYRDRAMKREHTTYLHPARRSPVITTSTNISSAQSSSSSPPYYKSPFTPNNYPPQWNSNDNVGSNARESNGTDRIQLPAIPVDLPRAAQNMLSAVYDNLDLDNPLKRKKLLSMSSMLLTRDTPILRNVLAQSNVADSSQNALPLLTNPSPQRGNNNSNNNSNNHNNSDNNENNDSNNNDHGSNNSTTNYSSPSTNATPGNGNGVYVSFMRKGDRSYHSSNGSDNSEKKYKDEEPQSPYTDKSFDDEPQPERRPRESPPDYANDLRLTNYLQQHQLQQAQFHQQQVQQIAQQSSGGSGGSQKPEWKRYKQYTRADIMAAIECVRNGMSALQASRKYGVPSRTLYDKVKKLGITTGTPRNRSSLKRESGSSGGGGPSSSSSAFPYAALGVAPPNFNMYPNQDNQLSQSQDFDHEMDEMKHRRNSHAAVALLDPTFLQKALEARDAEMSGRDALHAMALAAAAHAQFNGISSSPHAHGSRSPTELLKIINRRHEAEIMERRNGEHTIIKREPIDESEDEMMDCDDKVENLSMQKRDSSSPSNTPPPHSPQYLAASISITDPSQHTPRGVIMPPIKYTSPRPEPSSTTPPCSDQPMALDKSDLKINLNDPSITPTTTANYDD